MSVKSERLSILKDLIGSKKAANQEFLCTLLETKGYKVTQATLSRDLKELKVFKTPDGSGGYRYSLPETASTEENSPEAHPFSLVGIKSVEFEDKIGVIKTRPGYANMIGSIIDARLRRELMGTIAGDDTLLMIVRKGFSDKSVLEAISNIIPGIESKLL
ncbi:MAG: hypothetical protein WCS67_06170 [Bacteroidales bacterium]